MARIEPITSTEILPAIKNTFQQHTTDYKEPITNSKVTLGHSVLPFEVYMQWHPLYQAVEEILGKRLAYLYGYAISNQSACTVCSTFFRKIIIDNGENPDHLSLTSTEKNIFDFGEAVTKCHGNIANHIFNSIALQYSKKDLVTLIAFAGQMIATNIFNNVVETDLDEELQNYLPVIKSIWD